MCIRDRQLSRKEQLEEKRNKIILSTEISIKSCPTCDEKHPFWKCKKYEALAPKKRFDAVMKMRRCWNCLKEGHEVVACPSSILCRVTGCSEKHHTTLHEHFAVTNNESGEGSNIGINNVNISHTTHKQKRVFLQIVPVKL